MIIQKHPFKMEIPKNMILKQQSRLLDGQKFKDDKRIFKILEHDYCPLDKVWQYQFKEPTNDKIIIRNFDFIHKLLETNKFICI